MNALVKNFALFNLSRKVVNVNLEGFSLIVVEHEYIVDCYKYYNKHNTILNLDKSCVYGEIFD